MTDVASLAIQVDARQAAMATEQLDKLATSGARAERSTDKLGREFRDAATAARTMGNAEGAARTQTDQLAASQTRATAAMRANEASLARFGVTMTHASGQSRAMAANMLNLSRQGADVATMFALGAPPMQIFASQGLQIVDVLAMMKREASQTGDSLTAMATRGLGRIVPIASSLAAVLGIAAIGMRGVTNEINRNSDVTVGWGDVVMGTYDAVAAAVDSSVGDAWRRFQAEFSHDLDQMASNTARELSSVAGFFLAAYYEAVAAWDNLPAAFAELFLNTANGAIQFIEDMINGGITLINQFSATVDSVLGTELGRIGNVDIPGLENNYRGAGERLGTAMSDAQMRGYRDAQLGRMLDYVQPFIQARATATDEAETTGRAVGGAVGRAAGATMSEEMAQAIEDALKDAAILAAEIANGTAAKVNENLNAVKRKQGEDLAAARAVSDAARQLEQDRINDMASLYETLFTDGVDGIWSTFKKQGIATISQLAAQWTLATVSGGGGGINGLLGNLGGAASANPIGMFVALTSLSNSIGKGIAKLTGANYSSGAGSIFGAGAGFAVGALKGTPSGYANVSDGLFSGSGGKLGKQAGGAGNSVASALANIAQALGVSLSGSSVSIGLRGDNWVVDPTGKGATKKGKGAVGFGQDGDAAIAFAIVDAINESAGVSASVKALLGKSGSDLQAQLDKAVKFQSVFDMLLEATDPMAYALKGITDQFADLRKIFDEAGASASEYADFEKLLALKREDAVDAARQSKLDDLSEKFGLQVRLLELIGNGEEALTAARILEVAGMKAALQPLQAMVYELEDARGVIEKFAPLGDALRAFKQELTGGSAGASFGALTARFRATASNAAIGDATALGAFQADATAYLEAAKANASSSLEYQRALSEVLVGTDKGIFAADTQVQMAQATIDAVVSQTNVLEQMRGEIRDANVQLASNTGALLRLWQRFEGEGLLVRTDADTPLAVTTP